jgi:hypothetical protein
MDVFARAHIEAASGLGDDDRLGLARQDPGKQDLLHVSAGEATDPVLGGGLDREALDEALGMAPDAGVIEEGAAPKAVEFLDDQVLGHGQSGMTLP